MSSKYNLIVHGAGSYSHDSLALLLWEVIKHRVEHLLNGDGWID
jgi:hypothetical protein